MADAGTVQVIAGEIAVPSGANAVTVYPVMVEPFSDPGVQLTLILLSRETGALTVAGVGFAAGVTGELAIESAELVELPFAVELVVTLKV